MVPEVRSNRRAGREIDRIADSTAVVMHRDNGEALVRHNRDHVDGVITQQLAGIVNGLHESRAIFARDALIGAQALSDNGQPAAARAVAMIVAEATRQTGFIAERFTLKHA